MNKKSWDEMANERELNIMQQGKLFDLLEVYQADESQRTKILERQIAKEEALLSKEEVALVKEQVARLRK